MAKNLIKLWLILATLTVSAVGHAANSYRFGYFDEASPSTLKTETLNDWLRDGLKAGGVKGTVKTQVKAVNSKSTDDELRSLDFLILRGDLEASRKFAERFSGIGGRLVISDRWTREDLGVDNLAVLSASLPTEKRITPLLLWLGKDAAGKAPKLAAYITQADSDFDKIWFFEMSKNSAAKNWQWKEIALKTSDTKVDFKFHKAQDHVLVLSRVNPELLTKLIASEMPIKTVIAADPWLETPNDKMSEFFKKNSMTYYLTTYPKGLTGEARDFEKANKDATAFDATLCDALVLTGKALARSQARVSSKGNFFAALDGLKLQGVSGEIKIERGNMWREVFVIGQRGDNRILEWRSGLVK